MLKISRIKKDELIKGGFILLITIGIFNILNYIFQMSMAKILGPADYGVLAVLMSFIYIMTIKIYTTTTCPYCKMEKDYLDSKQIKYENIFVDNDTKAAQEMLQESGQLGVPFTVIEKNDNSEVKILGFDKQKLNESLGIE